MNSATRIRFVSIIGELELSLDEKGIQSLSIEPNLTEEKSLTKTPSKQRTENKASLVVSQLEDYFCKATPFSNLSLLPQGTDFQKSVWRELSKIPLGETRSYGQIAKKLNSSPRAVGNACRRNPIAIIIPCHRVIAATGIGGYAGETGGAQLNIKRWLLQHEGVSFD